MKLVLKEEERCLKLLDSLSLIVFWRQVDMLPSHVLDDIQHNPLIQQLASRVPAWQLHTLSLFR